MKIGINGFALPGLRLDSFQRLEFARARGLDGVFFDALPGTDSGLDSGMLTAVRDRADELGLFMEVGIGAVNPTRFPAGSAVWQLGDGDYRRGLERQVRACRSIDRVELRSALGGEAARFDTILSWDAQLTAIEAFLRSLAPFLRDLGCRINIETHADATTFELVRLVEAVGPDVLGICLDTANVLCRMEDPLEAARRAAPYVHQTHAKDAIVYFTDDGLQRQTRPCGQGVIDWAALVSILGEHSPDLALCIEDHQGLFGMAIYDPAWHALHPDLTASEMSEVVRLARRCESKIAEGSMEPPDRYEAVVWADVALDRLDEATRHLRHTLQGPALAS